MSEQAVVAESSPVIAPVMDVSRGPLVDITSEQRAEFRKTGELPTKELPKTEEAAPSSEAKPEKVAAETAGESETPETQEKAEQPKPKTQTAKERIAQLEATIDRIRREAGIKVGLKETNNAEPSPAKPESKTQPATPQNYQEWRKDFKPTEWIEQYSKQNPTISYEDANAAMADYLSDVRDEFKSFTQKQDAQSKEFFSKVDEARTRYENFDEVVQPTATAINTDANISPVIKQLLSESDVLPDMLFTLGSDPAELAKFVKMAKETPGKALRYIALTESLIAEELAGKPAKEETPVKPKTNAPRPPSEAGGRAAAPPDALDAAAKANDFASFKAEATRRQLAKMKS